MLFTVRSVPLAAAIAWIALNLAKPVHVDDTYHWAYARQTVVEPADPFGFLLLWWDEPEPASRLIGMPVVSYWWGLGLRLFGDSEWASKLWMFPFPWLLCNSLHGLLRRWAAPWADQILVATVLGPALLPSLNLMLDVPALSLEITALLCLVRAAESRPEAGPLGLRATLFAVLAGVSAGLATQTKYSGLVAPPLLVLLGLAVRRPWLGVLSAGAGMLLFGAWELFAFVQYGGSFLARRLQSGSLPGSKIELVIPLLGCLGSVAPWLGLTSSLALGVSRRAILGWGGAIASSLLTLTFVPSHLAQLSGTGREAADNWTLGLLLFVALGAAVASALLWACRRLLAGPADGIDVFLVCWLLVELVAYAAITPFPAVRRVLGVVVAGFVVTGRGLARVSPQPASSLVRAIVVASTACGLLFQGVDVLEARAQRSGVTQAIAWIEQHDSRAAPPVWYVGHWGFQYYAERAGMRAAVSRRFEQATRFAAGDWLIVPSRRVDQQAIQLRPGRVERIHVVRVRDPVPLATLPFFYSGWSGLGRLEGPRLRVTIYRVLAPHAP